MKEKTIIPFDLRAAGVPAVDWSKVDCSTDRRPPRYPAEEQVVFKTGVPWRITGTVLTREEVEAVTETFRV